jgi:hypothetical protein
VTGRGRRASLPADGHSRPEYLVAEGQGALTVRHYNRDGDVREYDFGSLPVGGPMKASLAALFAARCTPDRWSAHDTSREAWVYVRQFADFLARLERPPRDLEDITAELARDWRESLPVTKGGHNAFTTVAGILRDDARLQAGPAADQLAVRRKKPRSKVQSYGQAEFALVTSAARRGFRAALQRINDNALHLQRWREGAFPAGSRDWVIGDGLDIIARTGRLPRYEGRSYRGTVEMRYRRAFGPRGLTWQRLFLTRHEAVALGVLLMAEFGWNLSVVSRLEVPGSSPDPGEDGHPVYRVELVKPRRGPGRHYETRSAADYGADSPGRLITQALQATRFARGIVEHRAPGTRRLIVWRAWRPSGQFRFGIDDNAVSNWAEAEGLEGHPFQRGRRTVIALDRRQPGQHSQDTHDRHYVLPDKRVQAEAGDVIASGAEDAATRARHAVLVAQLRDRPASGDAQTATADCSGVRDSPWPSPDGGCRASFLSCLACPNARVHPGHHPRLAYLHQALGSLRSVLPSGVWAADWRDTHDRLEDLRQQVGEGPWALGLSRLTSADRVVIDHLLTGALDT